MKYIRLICYLLAMLCIVSCHDLPTQEQHVAKPVFTPTRGNYALDQVISLICTTNGAKIYYTIDGIEPDTLSQLYTAPFVLGDIMAPVTNAVTLRARAFKTDSNPSETVIATYMTDYAETVAEVSIEPAGGSGVVGMLVTLDCSTPDAQIRFTINGNEPTYHSSLYTAPFPLLSGGLTTLRTRAFRAGWNPSPFVSEQFTVRIPAPDMATVEAGSFFNGTANVNISSFLIDKLEVSQNHYNAVMAANMKLDPSKSIYPVYYVSWFNAIEYCNRRSILEGREACYAYSGHGTNPDDWPTGWDNEGSHHNNISCDWDADGYRLPTEMEWMYAARGGNISQNYIYSGSDDVNEVAWCDTNSGYSVHPVGQKSPNELGIRDMSGNVWEWCWDIFGAYPSTDQTDPHGPANGEQRVLRGGSWYSSPIFCTVGARYSYYPSFYQGASIGFRCCRMFLPYPRY